MKKSYFTLDELCKSITAKNRGIPNMPNANQRECLEELIDKVLNPLREAYGKPIIVSSGFRCPALNNVVGGAKNSQHTMGQAADIHSVEDTPEENKKIYDLAVKLKLPFDQIINEYNYNWVHISYSFRNRRQEVVVK